MGGTLKVAVVAGGPSNEAEVSRTSARAVSGALVRAGHEAEIVELAPGAPAELLEGGYDVVFPAVHGPLGEDGGLQGALEVLDLPYVGSGVLASARAAYKPAAKQAFRAAALPVAGELLVMRGDNLDDAVLRIRAELGGGVAAKPASGGSAIGVGLIGADASDAELRDALERALEVDAVVLAEELVEGYEVTCGVLDLGEGLKALPPTLVEAHAAEWYDFESRYAEGGSHHRCPAPLTQRRLDRIQQISLAAFNSVGARDLGRMDFVVPADEGQEVVLLEVNTLPGMTSTSLFPEAAGVAGISFEALCDGLVRVAAARGRRVWPEVVPMPD